MTIDTLADSIMLHQESDNSFSACLTLPLQLTAFEGHFPGKPILPGVAYVFIAENLVSRFCQKPFKLKQLKRTKFFQPSEPLDVLTIQGNIALNASNENSLEAQVLFSDARKQRISLVKMTMEL